jgi:hypothetical protein
MAQAAGKNLEVRDNTRRIFQALETLLGHEILVGIPEDKSQRPGDSDITNAALAYIHEFGSPAANVPARPFLFRGIAAAEKPVLLQLKKAGKAAMDGDAGRALQYMHAAGSVASNSVRDTLLKGEGWDPLSPQTILNRNRSRGTKSHRKEELYYLALYSSGMDAADAQSAANIKPLINTGEMFRAITYVIKKV